MKACNSLIYIRIHRPLTERTAPAARAQCPDAGAGGGGGDRSRYGLRPGRSRGRGPGSGAGLRAWMRIVDQYGAGRDACAPACGCPGNLAPLQDRLQYLRRKRCERNVRIVSKLQGLGVEIELDEVLHEAHGVERRAPAHRRRAGPQGLREGRQRGLQGISGLLRPGLPAQGGPAARRGRGSPFFAGRHGLPGPSHVAKTARGLAGSLHRTPPALRAHGPSKPITANIPRPLPGAVWSWPAITVWASAADRTITATNKPRIPSGQGLTAPCACPTACWKTCARCAPGAACPARAWCLQIVFGEGTPLLPCGFRRRRMQKSRDPHGGPRFFRQ